MSERQVDRSLKGVVSDWGSSVKELFSVSVVMDCKECGGKRPVVNPGPCPHPGSDLSEADLAINIRLAKGAPLLKKPSERLPDANGGMGTRLDRRVEGKRRQEAEEEHTSEEGISTRQRTDGGKSRSDYVMKPRYQFGEPDDFQQKVDAHLHTYEPEPPKDDDVEGWDDNNDLPHYELNHR